MLTLLFPSIAFISVGLAAMYVLHLHLLRKDTFLAKVEEVATTQNQLRIQLQELDAMKLELKKIKEDLTGVSLKLHITKGSR